MHLHRKHMEISLMIINVVCVYVCGFVTVIPRLGWLSVGLRLEEEKLRLSEDSVEESFMWSNWIMEVYLNVQPGLSFITVTSNQIMKKVWNKSVLTCRQTSQDENPLKVDHKLKHTENVIIRPSAQQLKHKTSFSECVSVSQWELY